jgi:hypothetical protein
MAIHRSNLRALYQALEENIGLQTGLIWRVEAILGGANATGHVYSVLVLMIATGEYVPVTVQFTKQVVTNVTQVTGSESTTLATALTNLLTVFEAASTVASQVVGWGDSA